MPGNRVVCTSLCCFYYGGDGHPTKINKKKIKDEHANYITTEITTKITCQTC